MQSPNSPVAMSPAANNPVENSSVASTSAAASSPVSSIPVASENSGGADRPLTSGAPERSASTPGPEDGAAGLNEATELGASVTSEEPTADGLITVVGSINVDLIARTLRHPQPGETVLGSDVQTLPGGKGANQAVAAALQGGPVRMIGAVGSDTFGHVALSGLIAADVDISTVEYCAGATGMALITVNQQGENSIVMIPGANEAVNLHAVQQSREAIESSQVVVLQGEIPPAAVEAAIRLTSGRVIFNLAPVIEVSPTVLCTADPLVVNEHEAEAAARLLGEADVANAPEALAAQLVARGARSVVMTLGADGAVIATARPGESREADIQQVKAPCVSAVDTTGAGDAFTGALATRIAAGDSLGQAAGVAVRVGSYSVQHAGAQASYPGRNVELPPVA